MTGFKTALVIALTFRLSNVFAFPEPAHNDVELAPAFHVLGNQTEGFAGMEGFPQKNLLERQSCPAPYGQCDNTGECCPQGPNCCGLYCIGLREQGTKCCNGYMCPKLWKCCGTSGSHCAPENGVCCTADGHFCPENWSCCGNQGYCYPKKDFHCCSNDGKFCPNGYDCVYCSAGSTEICCRGQGGAVIPVYITGAPEVGSGGDGSAAPSIEIPNPDTAAPPITTPPPSSSSSSTTTRRERTPTTDDGSSSSPTANAVDSDPDFSSDVDDADTDKGQYYTTTFTYVYVYYTIFAPISTVETSTTTTVTILSVYALNSADARYTLNSRCSRIESIASSSAEAASPTLPTVTSTQSVEPTLTFAAGAGGGSGAGNSGRVANWGLGMSAIGISVAVLLI